MNKAILNQKVQEYINDHLNADISKIVLKKSPFGDIKSQELAEQIQSKKAIQKKLPLWFTTQNIIYPPKLNLEQASSESTAYYKSTLISAKTSVIDLTGGFGVDDLYFAQRAKKVIHCERNASLSEIVKHNTEMLGINNIDFFVGDSAERLMELESIDTIYIDPSRRSAHGRVFLLEDCEPNVIESQNIYLKKSKKTIIKVAPMLDIDAALKTLNHVTEVHIVSLNNECKELLFVIEKGHAKANHIQLICTLLSSEVGKFSTYTFDYGKEKDIEIEHGEIQKYLYEPDASLLKAGLFKSIAKRFNLIKLNQHSHLYTSNNSLQNFPGRLLKVISQQSFKSFQSSNQLKKANVIVRNFAKKPDELKKNLKIIDGGDIYLYFTTDYNNSPTVITCERI
ncbi:hypothetical protein Pedsa_0916 [Pseudopedobacter saltans DSM 12145]|uniref:Uncharacterized protein n=1 Tax=Pseudopedobacter saltans (strain ATCC 51119 / DSM 12145 / JCM 21818 / CCUG 39354 / LMG 10337 / NBRC 100064 / NCIMB 13643) TaxID=762903 RepID=F0SAB1_PSESL|nr:RsmD family RNA methyltransferase [Pseudopedobacter saltans]ADY51488.1 hypothetical protein Pedsa_0916 [Pseudopedobacter saltans DSM 12145]